MTHGRRTISYTSLDDIMPDVESLIHPAHHFSFVIPIEK